MSAGVEIAIGSECSKRVKVAGDCDVESMDVNMLKAEARKQARLFRLSTT